ncbi:hypothetical protein CDD81_7131 [Ophiocordyceps australis]|uniref:Protein kinase domain-containing protein n=1 Tax=Ophiocordyceps australis TaxID=1399860 RepID=A0A2C5Y596_9HYPO|nr:hypothetical protein CDD81_7131 [Ophiocordyceps australis]
MECMRNQFVSGTLLNDGRYQTLSALNHGSFGMVFMAQDLSIDQPVAIKCLTKKSAPADAGLDLSIDDKSEELDLHRSLGSHANIVNLIDSFETDAHVYLVLEFCPQGDLYEAIRNGHGPLQTEHVRQFMLQLVDAVEFIHSKGIYHRDIKPENIFLAQDGSLKLGDFGLATTDKWSFEMMVGSDRYMAPEQFDSAGAGYSPSAADIWAIGICLLNILFSRNPFTTPTESDPLFLDFSRDKQSLFDVFPAMSQDTYEVIVQCMSLDPRKRSLVGAREALLRVVSFTTEDESLDDFCGGEKTAVASANREPLRTPSLQTPVTENGAFPWAKALHTGPHCQTRPLSVIADDESYTEDLFSRSQGTTDWCSTSILTPSLYSGHDSPLDASMRSLAIMPRASRSGKAGQSSGSLPINMIKPPMPSMSTIFGHRKEVVSKSWSDMWEEDEEELRQRQRESRMELNSRSWSHDSRDKAEHESASHNIKGDVDDDMVTDGFFFQDSREAKKMSPVSTPRYSPPSKRLNYDKWAALGERRRGQKCVLDMDQSPGPKPRRQAGIGYSKSQEVGVFEHSCGNLTHHFLGSGKSWSKDRSKDCVWNKGRDWNWRRERRVDLADVEWVGGW